MRQTSSAIALAATLLCAPPAFGNDADAERKWVPAAEAHILTAAAPLSTVVTGERGGLLPALYVGLATLNTFDAYSTHRGLARGAVEANPLMRHAAGRPAVMWAVKGGVTAATIAVAERLWRTNRKTEAVAVMLVSNGLMATVAARNAGVLRQQRSN